MASGERGGSASRELERGGCVVVCELGSGQREREREEGKGEGEKERAGGAVGKSIEAFVRRVQLSD